MEYTISICRECGKVYKPRRWFNWLDFCQICQANLIEYFERQMRFCNRPKLVKRKHA